MSKAKSVFKQASTVFLILASFVILNTTTAHGQQCTRANPTVTITPASQSSFPGGQLTFTVTVTNNDSLSCPASTFTTMATFPSDGFVHRPECVRLTLSPGQSRSRNVTINIPGGACTGPLTFRETAINDSVPSSSGFADATINVVPIVPDCGRAAPSVTITPVARRGIRGEQIFFQVTVKNNDSLACDGSDFIVTPRLTGGSFTSTPGNFILSIRPGNSASRTLFIQSGTFAIGDATFESLAPTIIDFSFSVTATHACATCLVGSASGTFNRDTRTAFCCGTIVRPSGQEVISIGEGCTRIVRDMDVCQGLVLFCDNGGCLQSGGTVIEPRPLP